MIENDNIDDLILSKLSKLDNLEKKINELTNDIKEIKENSQKMADHIIFIENLYQTMRHPLHKILSYFN